MIRLFTVLMLLFFQALPVYGQQSVADSLLKVLEGVRKTEERVDILNEVSSHYYDYDVNKGYVYAAQAYDLAKKQRYFRGMRRALTLKGFYYYDIGEYSRALFFYGQASTLEMPADELLGYNYVLTGNVYRSLAQYDSARSNYEKALGVLTPLDAQVQIAFAYKNIARLYVLQWKNKEAEEYFLKAAEIYARLNRKKPLADTWFSLSDFSKNVSNMAQANEYVEKACGIAEGLDDEFLKLYCLMHRGKIHHRTGENAKALEDLFKALELLKAKDLPAATASVYYNIGEVYEALGQNDIALKYFFESLAIAERLGISHEIAKVLSSIGWIYKNQHNFALAHRYVNRSLALREKIRDQHGISNCYNVRGLIYFQAAQYDSTVYWLERSLKIRREIGYREGISACTYNLSLVYQERKQYQKALVYQLEAIAIDEAIGNKYSIGISCNSLGNIYTLLKNYEEARQYLERAEQLAKVTQSKTLAMNNYFHWSAYYEATGDAARALSFHKRYAALNDSIYFESSAGKLAEMEALYQVEQKDQEIRLLGQEKQLQESEILLQRSKISLQNIVIISTIACLLLVSLLAIKSYQYSRRIRKAHREITEQKEEIQAQSEELKEANQTIAQINKKLEAKIEDRTSALRQAYKELDTFFYRSSHDFRRPLTTFLGLAEVAKITVKDQNALELFAKVKDTAQNLDKMLVKLQSISDVGAQQLVYKEVFLKDIFENVEDSFQEDLEQKGIRTFVDVALQDPFYSYPAMVKIIIENLMENAISFSNPEEPYVRFHAFQEDHHVVLEVQDNGQGIEPQYQDRLFDMYFRGTERSKGNGLGLYIVKKAVEKLSGDISFVSELGRGSTFRVMLPLRVEVPN